MSEFDYDSLDPGIRLVVRLLHYWDFETTDSGDGRTKGDAGESEPHVYIRTSAEDIVSDAERLRACLQSIMIPVAPVNVYGMPMIQVTYDPAGGEHAAIMALHNLDDEALWTALKDCQSPLRQLLTR